MTKNFLQRFFSPSSPNGNPFCRLNKTTVVFKHLIHQRVRRFVILYLYFQMLSCAHWRTIRRNAVLEWWCSSFPCVPIIQMVVGPRIFCEALRWRYFLELSLFDFPFHTFSHRTRLVFSATKHGILLGVSVSSAGKVSCRTRYPRLNATIKPFFLFFPKFSFIVNR